jgi:pimeloyl-ACP methyl ester carboxylesterase
MADSDFEILDERFRTCVKLSARVERLYDGCRWAEGPVYFPAHRSLVFSDIPNDFTHHLVAVARHYGPAAALVGHSLGGAASTLALARGLDAQRVVLIAPAADPIDATRRFARIVGIAEDLRRRLCRVLEDETAISVDSQQAHLAAPHIARPALIVHDLDDAEVPWAEGERYARFWPDSRLMTTTGLGHNRIAHDPSVIDATLAFLDGRTVGERVVSTPNLPFGYA